MLHPKHTKDIFVQAWSVVLHKNELWKSNYLNKKHFNVSSPLQTPPELLEQAANWPRAQQPEEWGWWALLYPKPLLPGTYSHHSDLTGSPRGSGWKSTQRRMHPAASPESQDSMSILVPERHENESRKCKGDHYIQEPSKCSVAFMQNNTSSMFLFTHYIYIRCGRETGLKRSPHLADRDFQCCC